ncbi:MAG TPA: contractile injection system tape measure protein, partial [Phnomibacter sp.]|nr:contractile injection system tape measure protein [Phnomibacter sp.]
MTTGQQHRIHRAQVDISSPTWLDSQATQHWVQGKLLEILDEVMSEWSDEHVAQVLDHLHIECHVHSMQAMNEESTRQQIRRQVEQALSHAASDGALHKGRQTAPSLAMNDLLMYLGSGSIPEKQTIEKWRQSLITPDALSAMNAENGYALLKMLQFPNAWQRFRHLIADTQRFDEVVLSLLASHSYHLSNWLSWFEQANSNASFSSDAERHHVLHCLIKSCFIPSTDVSNYLQETLGTLGFGTPEQTSYTTEDWKSKKQMTEAAFKESLTEVKGKDPTLAESLIAPTLNKNEQVYAANAGAILVAPFLPRFFQQLQIDPAQHEEAAQQASLLVHYLATVNTHAFDWELALPKLLCAVPFETVIDSNTGIPGEWKEEADHLLSAVISHWSKLGNTSVAALRQSFLQRDGQLELKESRITLKIPERTEDILLQFI